MTSIQQFEQKPVESYAAAKIYLESAAAELAGRPVTVKASNQGFTVRTQSVAPDEAGDILIDAYANDVKNTQYQALQVLRVSTLKLLQPDNPNYFRVAMRALCGIAFERKHSFIEFTDMTLPYVKGLLPFGAVPLVVPDQLDRVMAATMANTAVSRHIGIDAYARLANIQRRALRVPHMAWLDLFMTSLPDRGEDIAKVPVDQSEDFKRRLGMRNNMTVVISLRYMRPVLTTMAGPMPEFAPPSQEEAHKDYAKVAEWQAYKPPALFSSLDY